MNPFVNFYLVFPFKANDLFFDVLLRVGSPVVMGMMLLSLLLCCQEMACKVVYILTF